MDEGRKKRIKLGGAIALVGAFCGGLGGAVLYNFTSGSQKECSVLTNFTMKTEDRATFEWENGEVARANLVKEKDECIYRGSFPGEQESRVLVSGCRGEERNIAIQSIEHCDTDATLLRNGTFYFPDLFDDSLVNDSYDYEDYEEPEDYREKRSTWDDEDYQYSGDYQYEDYEEEYLENDDFDKDYPILRDVAFSEPIFPKVLRLPVHVYLSPSWIQIVGKGNPKTARTVAKNVLARANEHLRHHSMDPTHINIVYQNNTFFDAAEELDPSREGLELLTCKNQILPCFVNLPKDERVAIVYLQSNPY